MRPCANPESEVIFPSNGNLAICELESSFLKFRKFGKTFIFNLECSDCFLWIKTQQNFYDLKTLAKRFDRGRPKVFLIQKNGQEWIDVTENSHIEIYDEKVTASFMHLTSERILKNWKLEKISLIPDDSVLKEIKDCSNKESFLKIMNRKNTRQTTSARVHQRTSFEVIGKMTSHDLTRNITLTPYFDEDDFNVKNGMITHYDRFKNIIKPTSEKNIKISLKNFADSSGVIFVSSEPVYILGLDQMTLTFSDLSTTDISTYSDLFSFNETSNKYHPTQRCFSSENFYIKNFHTEGLTNRTMNDEDITQTEIIHEKSYPLETTAIFLIIGLLFGIFLFIYYFLRER